MVPFKGNKTVKAGELTISQFIKGEFDADYVNKESITFTNGNATINFGTQMKKETIIMP